MLNLGIRYEFEMKLVVHFGICTAFSLSIPNIDLNANIDLTTAHVDL